MQTAILAFALVAGVISAFVSQTLTGWWLDSGRGVALMMATTGLGDERLFADRPWVAARCDDERADGGNRGLVEMSPR